MKTILTGLSIIAAFLIVGFLCTGLDLAQFNFWAPKFENAKRNVYEQTKSYRDGSRRDFENLYTQYLAQPDPASKAAVLSVAKERADGVDPAIVPQNLKDLLCTQLKDCM